MDYVNSAHYEVRTKTFRTQMCNLEACSEHMQVKQWDYSYDSYHTVAFSINHIYKSTNDLLFAVCVTVYPYICAFK